MRVGFSGTRQGMSQSQVLHVHMLLGDLKTAGASQASHGMCQGSDKQFHEMAKALGYFMIGCPGVTLDGRTYQRANVTCDLVMSPRPFLARNWTIVRESDVLIFTPKEREEQARGSGTWATVRYTRKAEKPLVILWPDGSSTVEGVSGVTTVEQYREQMCNQLQEEPK